VSDETRPIPLLGEVSLESVQSIEHDLDAGFVAVAIPGLEGELQQRFARGSHRMRIRGLLVGDGAADALHDLQGAAATGDELTFAADITSALDLQHVVIERLHAVEHAGEPGTYAYELTICESPPLPAPAQVAAVGGFGGLGDLGLDTSILDDISSAADELGAAVDAAMDAVNQLQGLAQLGSLGSVGGLLAPLTGQSGQIGEIGSGLGDAARKADEGLA
jgi:hypothetical protein